MATKKKDKMSHGGAREGAGRPVDPNSKKALSLRVPVDVRQYLDTTENISQSIEDLVRRSKGYRDWRKQNPAKKA